MAEGLDSIIAQLERQKAAIENALNALREVEGIKSSSQPAVQENKRSIAQKARWAAKRAEGSAAKKTARKGGLSAAGRKRLADNMKKRWAAKRTAAQARKAGRKKTA